MKNKLVKFMCILCAMVMCCSVALAVNNTLGGQHRYGTYTKNVPGAFATLTANGRSNDAYSSAINTSSVSKYFSNLGVVERDGTGITGSAYNSGSVTGGSSLSTSKINRSPSNVYKIYVHSVTVYPSKDYGAKQDYLSYTAWQEFSYNN